VALVPFLYQMTRATPRQALLGGAAMGLVFHLGNLYWITGVMVHYGGLGRAASVSVLFALVAYLALYSSAFGGLAAAACSRGRTAALFVTPVFWVGLELFRNYPFGGFPWCLLGYSQVSVLPVLQIASLTSIHGVSLLVVLVNALIAYWLCGPGLKRGLVAAAPVALLLALTLGFGYRELARPLPPASFPVAAVQGNVLQEHKWEPGWATKIFTTHLELSTRATEQGARLVVWPESSTPFHFDGTPALAEAMRSFVRQTDSYLLFGSDDYIFPDRRDGGPDYQAFNGAKLLSPDGRVLLRYHKIFLVPFGEFVPLHSLLFFAESVVQNVSDFSAGEDVVVAPVDGKNIGAFICYEAIYPDLVRRFVEDGAALLVNVTNDAWFGRSSAPYQHLSQAIARAVETRRYLVRAANTGISALVDPYGRVLARSELFVPDVIVGKVSFLEEETFYVRHGNFLPRSMAVVTLIFGAVAIALHLRDKRRDQ
jgi:apolipoprotein N-acyltransferase